jgi:hypothetical protein
MRFAFLSTLFFAFLLIVSCSGSGNPVLPVKSDDPDGISAIDVSKSTIKVDDRGVFGAWKIKIDAQNLTAEIIPSRNAQAIGNIFDSDLSQFLLHSPCSNCLRISKIFFDNNWDEYPYYFKNRIYITFQMRHPFGNITTRPDLHGFDVRLILIGGRSTTPSYNSMSIMRPGGTTESVIMDREFVMNPDGYTPHYDELVTDERYFINGVDNPCNLNPFFRFFEDPRVTAFDPAAPEGQNVMPVGSSTDERTAIFNQRMMDPDGIEFYAVADVAYGQSATFQNRTSPQYYLPAFHRTEPWRVEYWIENNNLNMDDPAATAEVVVQVFDWQQGATVDPSYPNPANLSGIPESSNVDLLELSFRGLMGDTVVTADTPESGTGAPDNPLQYRLTVMNTSGSVQKTYEGLLAVRDELYGQASPSGRMPVPASPAGFPYETLDIVDYTLYEVISINQPFNGYDDSLFDGELDVDRTSLYMEHNNCIFATFFMDPSHSKFLYEWDLDYDGTTFDVEATGMPSPEVGYIDYGLYHAGLRVTTNSVPPRVYVFNIPIYFRFMGHRAMLNPSVGTVDTTYLNRNNALAITDTNYYLAYTSEATGQRDVCLAIGDKDFNFTTFNLTGGISDACYNPSIALITGSNPHAGIYVVFCNYNSGDPMVQSIYGNLDGSDFDPSHLETVYNAVDWIESNPCVINHTNRIYAYIQSTNQTITESEIRVFELNATFDNWDARGEIDSSITLALDPSVYYLSGYVNEVFCAFEVADNFATRGTDIYLARSDDPSSFTAGDSKNISRFLDDTVESYPSLSGFQFQLAIAYLANDPVYDEPRTFLTIMDANESSDVIFQYKHTMPSGFRDFAPAVSVEENGRYILATSSQTIASQDTWCSFAEIVHSQLTGFFSDNSLTTVEMGTVPPGAANAYPGIVSRRLTGSATVESFFVCRTFENGRTESPTPFTMQFGNIVPMNAITIARDN